MKRFLVFAVLVAAFAAVSQVSEAADERCYGPTSNTSWMFNRSYYSHEPVTPVQLGRRATGGPYYSRPTGAYINSGWRWNRSTISVGGQVWDNVNVIESWVQTGSQF